MIYKISIVILGLLSSGAVFAGAQKTKSIVVPEKKMAASLLTYETPALAKPPLPNRCSNALVVLRVLVGADGKVTSAEYLSGSSELKDQALAVVPEWSYKPYLVDGKPVAVETQASIFYLGDGESTPMYAPDGKGGTKGGNVIPLPPGCPPGPQIKKHN